MVQKQHYHWYDAPFIIYVSHAKLRKNLIYIYIYICVCVCVCVCVLVCVRVVCLFVCVWGGIVGCVLGFLLAQRQSLSSNYKLVYCLVNLQIIPAGASLQPPLCLSNRLCACLSIYVSLCF